MRGRTGKVLRSLSSDPSLIKVPFVRVGNLLYLSGAAPKAQSGEWMIGKVGREFSTEKAHEHEGKEIELSIFHTPQFGLVLSNRSVVTGAVTVEDLLTLAQRAEEAGWDSVWVGDSIFAKPRLDALVLLAALAARTRRVRLGAASLTSTPLRDPLQLAYQWFSLDVLSQGRMIFNASQGAPGTQGGAFEVAWARVADA